MNNDNIVYFKDMNLFAWITKYVCSILPLTESVIFFNIYRLFMKV
jgi:hypothetical protein